MNKELFASMRAQMHPSGASRAALAERLACEKKKAAPWGRYAAIAACLTAIVAAVPVYHAVREWYEWSMIIRNFHKDAIVEITEPHSYVLADGETRRPEESTATGSTDSGGGDRDQDMTPGEVVDNMLEAGFTREDVDGYLASRWQMTWAKWYKFCHLTKAGDRTLESLLDFSQEEGLAVNTGEAPELPGGAYVGDAPDQSEAVAAYQNLMARFEAEYGPDQYPEWYGGAYIDEHAGLIVNIVVYEEPEGKELFYQIQEWAGSGRVGFGSSELSLNQLKELQNKVLAVMEELGLACGCGINEETGQVELTLPEAHEEALWQLARLDPAGTAVHVVVARSAVTDALTEEPALTAPSVDHIIRPGGTDPNTPVTYVPGVGGVVDTPYALPGEDGPWQTEPRPGSDAPVSDTPGMIVDEDGVIAWEPQG